MSGWLSRLGLGLKKSSSRLSEGISSIFTKKKLDAATLEELEELLITSDMGVKTSSEIITAFAAERQDKDIESQTIRLKLAEEIAKILLPCQKKLTIDDKKKPFVFLISCLTFV